MYTSMISGPFTLFVLWTIAFPFCTAQLYKHLFARSPGRFCHSHLPDGWPNITWPFDLESLDQYNGTTIAENSPQVRRIRGLIRNQAALYPLIVDSKNFLFLKSVFTQDVTVNMSMSRPIVNGLPALQDALRDAFDGLQTHHQLGTPFVFAEYRHCLAETLTYFTATISGTGESSAKAVTTVGQYQDVWIKLPANHWRIAHRNIVFMGPPQGDVSILNN